MELEIEVIRPNHTNPPPKKSKHESRKTSMVLFLVSSPIHGYVHCLRTVDATAAPASLTPANISCRLQGCSHPVPTLCWASSDSLYDTCLFPHLSLAYSAAVSHLPFACSLSPCLPPSFLLFHLHPYLLIAHRHRNILLFLLIPVASTLAPLAHTAFNPR